MTLHSMQRGKIMTPACQGGTAGKRMSDDFTQAQETPWRYGFLNLMRRVDVQLCTVLAGNTGNHGWKISPRTNAHADLCATGNRQCELAGRTPAHQPVQSRAVGPNGPLPLHYTELARNRTESRRDPTLTRFSDLFHHRWLTQFYRARRSAQSAGGGLDKPQHDRFAFYVASLSGQDLRESADSPLPDHVARQHRRIWCVSPATLTGWPPRWLTISACLSGYKSMSCTG